MRFCYLRSALLAGLFATNASADSATTEIKMATSPMEPTPTSDRDDGMVSRSHYLTTIDDENRTTFIAKNFREEVLYTFVKTVRGVDGRSIDLDEMIDKGMTPSQLFKILALQSTTMNLLRDERWRTWAFFISKYAKLHRMDPHKAISDAMAAQYTTNQLIYIFKKAVENPKTAMVGIKLRDHAWLAKRLSPRDLLERLNLDFTKYNFVESPQFTTYAAYVRFMFDKNDDWFHYTLEVADLKHLFGEEVVIKLLISPENAKNVRWGAYMNFLIESWWIERKSPSEIGLMLVNKIHPSTNLNLTRESTVQVLRMWDCYLAQYNAFSGGQQKLIQSLTTTVGPARSAMMLYAAANTEQKEISWIGKQFQEKQFLDWAADGKTPNDVTKVLSESLAEIPRPESFLAKFAVEQTIAAYHQYYHTVHAPSNSLQATAFLQRRLRTGQKWPRT